MSIFKTLVSANGLGKPNLSIVHLPRLPIFQQLLFEESVYRLSQNDSNAWLILNDFTQTSNQYSNSRPTDNFFGGVQKGKSVILGISGKPEELVIKSSIENDSIEMIKRYTGGGTVLISPSVFMISLILPKAFFGVRAFPKDVMEWSGSLYGRVFGSWKGREFKCRENDYTIESADGNEKRKIGGNAQAFGRRFVVHHTSFLWDADYSAMHRYLSAPKRQPNYRGLRTHEDFVCGLNGPLGFPGRFDCPAEVIEATCREMGLECQSKGFEVNNLKWEDICEEAGVLVQQFMEENSNLRATWHVGFDGKPLHKKNNF